MLVIENVNCTYGSRKIFEGVSASMDKGALVVLHGPNGSGKTSLLKIVAGVMQPTHGMVLWDGNYIGHSIRNGEAIVNYVGHNYAVKPDLTVLENLDFWARLKGEEDQIPIALSSFGLVEYADRFCRELSDGWRKRVALATLICCPADLWVLDEPYNNLDAATCEFLDKMIEGHCQSGGIAVISSHTLVPINFASKLNIANYSPKKP